MKQDWKVSVILCYTRCDWYFFWFASNVGFFEGLSWKYHVLCVIGFNCECYEGFSVFFCIGIVAVPLLLYARHARTTLVEKDSRRRFFSYSFLFFCNPSILRLAFFRMFTCEQNFFNLFSCINTPYIYITFFIGKNGTAIRKELKLHRLFAMGNSSWL